ASARKAGFANFARTTEFGGEFWKNRLQTAYKFALRNHEHHVNTPHGCICSLGTHKFMRGRQDWSACSRELRGWLLLWYSASIEADANAPARNSSTIHQHAPCSAVLAHESCAPTVLDR